MRTKKVLPYLLASGVMISFPASAVAATADKCAELFNVSRDAKPRASQASSGSGQNALKPQAGANAIVIPSFTVPLKEIIEIRDGHVQTPPLDLFGPAYIGSSASVRSPMGEKIRVEFYPDAHPFSEKNKHNKQDSSYGELPHSGSQYDSLGYSNSGGSQNLPAMRGQVPSQIAGNEVAAQNLTDAEIREAARAYALQSFGSGRQIDEATLNFTVNFILSNPESMKEALKTRVAVKNARAINLTNFGTDRYFWFKPEGSSSYHAARIIDIHQNNNPSGVVFLIEYVAAAPTEGMRIRRIQQLRDTEVESLQAKVGDMDREDAAEAFFDTLSPDEIQTLKLAKELKLKLYGYTDINRGRDSNYNGLSALKEMNSITHLALQQHINDTFGGVEDLLTPSEKQLTYANYIDVFARLNAQFVLQKFGGPKGFNTTYYWLITEDGQLKIMPSQPKGRDTLKPRLLRLAGGRKIFAGGTFNYRADGSLDLKFEATSYQALDTKWGESAPFQEDNPNIKEFVSIVFGVQAGAKVASIGDMPIDSFTSGGSRPGYSSAGSQQQGQADDFVFNMKKKATTKSASAPTHSLDWDVEKAIPMDLAAFAEKRIGGSRFIPAETKLEWAHYVLKTKSTMAWGDIKKAYKKLIRRFHTDNNKSENANEIAQIITAAKTVLENELNPIKKQTREEDEAKKNGW